MDTDRRRTLAAITLIIGFFVLVAVVVGVLVSGKKILSPVPEDSSAIKIIFITPTPASTRDESTRGGPTQIPISVTSTVKPTAKPTP
jgi:hypothetical protein